MAHPLDDLLPWLLLAVSGAPRSRPVRVASALEQAFGVSLSPALRGWLEACEGATPQVTKLFVPYDVAEPPYTLPKRGNLFGYALDNPLLLHAAFANALPIGADGAGLTLFVSLDPAWDEVGLYDPGLGDMRLLARSLGALGGLTQLLKLWEAVAAARGVTSGDVIEEDVEIDVGDPDMAPLVALMDRLQGHVQVPAPDDSDVMILVDELLPTLMGEELSTQSLTSMVSDHARAASLVMLLSGVKDGPPPAPSPDEGGDVRLQDAMFGLVAAWFQEDTQLFERWSTVCREHPARLAQDAAALLSALEQDPRAAAGWSQLVTSRTLLRRGVETFVPSVSDPASLLAPAADEPPQLASYKEQLREQPGRAQLWDQLTYAAWEAGDWERMLACAGHSLAAKPAGAYAWQQRAIALEELGRLEQAIGVNDLAIALGGHSDCLLNKAGCWLALGDQAAAVSTLRRLPAHRRRALVAGRPDVAHLVDALEEEPG